MQDFQRLFQQAREAAAKGDFKMARKLYAELWKSPAWRADASVQLSYAYSCERTGDYSKALEAYKALMNNAQGLSPLSDEQNISEESLIRLREVMGDASEVDVLPPRDDLGGEAESELLVRLFSYGFSRKMMPGEVLCRQGEIAGHMWLLKSGSVDVILPHHIRSCLSAAEDSPCLMGELAYFTSMRRSATLCCATEVEVIELPYERVRALLEEEESLYKMMDYVFRHRLVFHLLSGHSIFKLFNECDRNRLASTFENSTVHAGQDLIEQNEEHPHAYMVQGGTLLLLDGEDGHESLLGSVQPGDFFNLGGLLRGQQSPCRVVAGTHCNLLRLSRPAFEPFLLQRPWLIRAVLKHVRLTVAQQIARSDDGPVWAADRHIKMKAR